MLRLGHGKADFAEFEKFGYHYVDRTQFIEVLENQDISYFLFLRPRRFGKSLWISTLKYYYGIQYQAKFQALFGKYYIGKNPTPFANQYLILYFNFSGINTENKTVLKESFLHSVWNNIVAFCQDYPHLFSEEDTKEISAQKNSEDLIRIFFRMLQNSAQKIYLLIDEYDHFTNELLSFDFHTFQNSVSKNGWIRKFYEVLKNAANQGIIERMFITGVSPVTLDSLTSGFNIATNITLDSRFHHLLGFTQAEVEYILKGIGVAEEDFEESMKILKEWYNGYLFNAEEKGRLYNANMVLYFANKYLERHKIPTDLLDNNIASDYRKIRGMFNIQNKESENIKALDTLLNEGSIQVNLTLSFNFEMNFTQADFISLLFYTGFLTIKSRDEFDFYELEIPNRVIEGLYRNYFLQVIEEEAHFSQDLSTLRLALKSLILDNNPQPIVQILTGTLKALSVRDYRSMSEKHIQAIFFSYLNLIKEYSVKSEYEAEGQYYDIFMRKNALASPRMINEFLFEFKYVRNAGDIATETLDKKTTQQVKRYLNHQEIQKHPNLHAWRIIIVKDEAKVCDEVAFEIVG